MESIDSFLPKPKNESDPNLNAPSNTSSLTVVSNLGPAERRMLQQTYSIPEYGSRGLPNKWRPRAVEDYGDGGAYPEIHVAQYPRGMGLPSSAKTRGLGNKTLALTVTDSGQIDYSSIARQGHVKDRRVQSSFQDLVPLRQRANNGTISLDRPSQDQVTETANKTQLALQKIVDGKVAASKPKSAVSSLGPASHANATFVRYTPTNMMGKEAEAKQRIIKIVDVQEDPLAPPKFKHSKVPARPPSPPPPVLRSPPRKLTAEDQKNWYIPPSVSNWKNPKGFTIAIDKRMASDGRRLQENTINDNFAKLSESLAVADTKMRQEVQYRNQQRKLMKEKEETERENKLKDLARKAKEEREAMLNKASAGKGRRSRFDSDGEDEDVDEKKTVEDNRKRERSPDSVSPPARRRRGSVGSDSSRSRSPVRRGATTRERGRDESVSVSPPPTPQRQRRRRDSESPPTSPSPRPNRRRRGSFVEGSRSRSPYERRSIGRRPRRDSRDSSADESRSPSPDIRGSHHGGRREYDNDRRGRGSRRRSASVSSASRSRSRSPSSSRSPPPRYRDRRRRRGSYSDDNDSEYDSDNRNSRGSRDSRNTRDYRDSRDSREDRESREERRRRADRADRLAEEKRKLRMSRMGTERRVKTMMLGTGDRDISERVALGVAKPTNVSGSAGGETQFDSRLMGRVSVSNRFNEDNVYDGALFKSSEAAASIYRAPKLNAGGRSHGGDDGEDDEMDERMKNESRFDTLGYAKRGFENSGAGDLPERSGPVEFEKDNGLGVDAGKVMPMDVDQMIKDVKEEHEKDNKGKGKKKESRWK